MFSNVFLLSFFFGPAFLEVARLHSVSTFPVFYPTCSFLCASLSFYLTHSLSRSPARSFSFCCNTLEDLFVTFLALMLQNIYITWMIFYTFITVQCVCVCAVGAAQYIFLLRIYLLEKIMHTHIVRTQSKTNASGKYILL